MTEPSNSNTAAKGCSSGKTAGVQIAVFLDSKQLPAAPHQAESVAFFAKRGTAWVQTGIKTIQPLYCTSSFLVTAFMEELASLVQDAQAIAGSSISGIAYTVFNRQGKHIFEIPDLSQMQLSGMAEDIAMAEAKRMLTSDAFEHAKPQETEVAGVYTMDLAAALETFPDLSTKIILKPFFTSTPFVTLILTCKHMPPWLPLEAGLTVTQKQEGNYLIVTVRKAVCKEETV